MSTLYAQYLAADQIVKRIEATNQVVETVVFYLPVTYSKRGVYVSIRWPYDASDEEKLLWASTYMRDYPDATSHKREIHYAGSDRDVITIEGTSHAGMEYRLRVGDVNRLPVMSEQEGSAATSEDPGEVQ